MSVLEDKLKEAYEEINKLNNDATHLIELHKKTLQENEKLNNIINEMEQFFIDNANDEMKKCFDKLHSLKGSDKE